MTQTSSRTAPSSLLWSSWIAIAAVAAQAVVAIFMLSGVHGLGELHAGFGYVTLIATIVAAVAAVMWKRKGGPAGIMGHALGMAVIVIIQFALGEAGVKWVHVVLGILIVAGLIALPMRARAVSR